LKFSYLLKECTPLWERTFISASDSEKDPEISSIHFRAQQVKPGGLFIAVKGFKSDGHDYIDEALKKGAVAIVAEKRLEFPEIRTVQVKNTRKAMACISSVFYHNPSEKMILIGVTGTNGKTTITWILESILNAAGYVPGVIGTINWRYKDHIFDNLNTTPESMELQKILFQMKQAGVTHVILEVSSHGIDLGRINNISFDIGIFTNLSQDHLDYHKNMKQYFLCKKRFFTKYLVKGTKKSFARAIINIDDQKGKLLLGSVLSKTITTSTKNNTADIKSYDVQDDILGLSGRIRIKEKNFSFQSELTGKFNLENILSATGACHVLGISIENIKKGIKRCKSIPGRLERIKNISNKFIFVDYAHTPNALEAVLKTLKKRALARIILIFGCGGDRDRAKRSIMGKIAFKYSDIAIITSDNPRTEDPNVIINDILKDLKDSLAKYRIKNFKNEFIKKGIFIEPDRKKALKTAIKISLPNDIVIAAGKGHETEQILKNNTIYFDDRKVLENAVVNYELDTGIK